SLMTREDYITNKMVIDKTVRNLEEQLKEVNTFQLLSTDRLTKEIVSTHIEKVVVDCLGYFTVIYK
ncbi:recombinase, partial [Streptococcus suis]